MRADIEGCPIDSDGDQIFDGLDLCADTPDKAIVDDKGCPLDTDKDSVFDGIDECAATPANDASNQFGCSPRQLDSDGDNFNNLDDACPYTPRGEAVNNTGCGQSELDDDGDGVSNVYEQCPNSKPGEPVDNVGCLVTAPNLITSNGTFSSGVQSFKTNLPNATATWSNEAKFTINKASTNMWDVQLWHEVALSQGVEYTICFDAKSDSFKEIGINIDSGAPDYLQLMHTTLYANLGTTYQHFSRTFTALMEDSSARCISIRRQ